MATKKGQLIVALDIDTLEEAKRFIDTLSPAVDIFKVGSQLFTACGPAAVRFILARGKKAFLDLKYHDIPNTVGNAVRAAVALSSAVSNASSFQAAGAVPGIFMYTAHTLGGKEMLKAAVNAAAEKAKELGVEKPLTLGITVLTSEEKKENIGEIVLERAKLAKEAGLDGVVASSQEAALIRRSLGSAFIIVTPGIRPAGAAQGDQKRIGTPAEAIAQGSNFLVVGRPIIEAQDPLAAAKQIVEEINSVKA